MEMAATDWRHARQQQLQKAALRAQLGYKDQKASMSEFINSSQLMVGKKEKHRTYFRARATESRLAKRYR
jgi:hypothetical protein